MQVRALVTGANGMLADALCPLLKENGYTLFLTDFVTDNNNIFKLDVKNLEEVKNVFKTYNPDIVFHLAAETDVDKCELNKKYAYKTNSQGTKNVAIACKKYGSTMVYISTAAVFDGEKLSGYTEEDEPNPISVYGKSKLKGEEAVSSILTKYYIVRASWMIGGYNKDKKFVWKIIQLLKTKKEIQAIIDKFGSPTFTKDFARGLLSIISTEKYGLYHCVNKGMCTRFDIARKIVEYLDRNDVILKPVTSDVFSLSAPRGKSEALVNYRLSCMNMNIMRPWEDALKEYLQNIRQH